jgi:heme/copper-type cytochrome/quinol oxidase subunit 1
MRNQSFWLPPHYKNLLYSQTVLPKEKILSNIDLELFEYLSQENLFWWLYAPLSIEQAIICKQTSYYIVLHDFSSSFFFTYVDEISLLRTIGCHFLDVKWRSLSTWSILSLIFLIVFGCMCDRLDLRVYRVYYFNCVCVSMCYDRPRERKTWNVNFYGPSA